MNNFSNRLNILSNYYNRQVRNLKGPVEIGIEVTNMCNLDCIMCPRSKMKRSVGRMDMATFDKIIKEIKPFAELVYLHGLGEPLLHPQIDDMIAKVHESGIKVGLSTNITLLDKKKSEMLIRAGLDYLIFPMEGVSAETYEKIRIGASFNKIIENINGFLEAEQRLRKRVYTVIQMVCQKENNADAKLLKRTWGRNKLINEVRIKPVQNLLAEDNSPGLYSGRLKNPPPCYYIWRQHDIFWDGAVSLCCMDVDKTFDIGNINEKSLLEIWNGDFFQRIRRMHLMGEAHKIPLCKVCNISQPSMMAVLGASILPDLTIKKILPKIERLHLLNFFKG